jgi:hypothetical protein
MPTRHQSPFLFGLVIDTPWSRLRLTQSGCLADHSKSKNGCVELQDFTRAPPEKGQGGTNASYLRRIP